MAIGNFLGGIAQGVKAGADTKSREKELQLRQQGLTPWASRSSALHSNK